MELTQVAAPARQISFLGVEFTAVSMATALDTVVEAASSGRPFSYVVTPNVDHVVMFHQRGRQAWIPAYRTAVADACLRLNDSRILAALASVSGLTLPVTPGSDLTHLLVERAAAGNTSLRWLLVGGARAEAEWLKGRLPGHDIRHYEPPMGVRDDTTAQAAIVERVSDERADIVLFAIGAPQSEIVAQAILRNGNARGIGLCIGASVEFLSGAKSRAPLVMQRAGLEWLYRLVREPSRLWRRYLLRGPRIFSIWWKFR